MFTSNEFPGSYFTYRDKSTIIEIRVGISNYIHLKLWDAIIDLCPNFNGGLADKPPWS